MEPLLVINAKAKDLAGFPVRRAFPAIERRMTGPFIFLDQMGPTLLAAGRGWMFARIRISASAP